MNLQTQCKQEEPIITELDNLLSNLREEVGYNNDLLQTLFYTANKLKTIQEEVAAESNKCSVVSPNPPSSLEQLDYLIAVQRRNNQKLNKLVNHLNQVI